MNKIDMHCDTIAQLYYAESQGRDSSLAKNALCIDLDKMRRGGYLLQNFAMFVDKCRFENPTEAALGMIDLYYRELEKNSSVIAPVFSYEDILRNQKEGRMGAMLTLEEGCVVHGQLSLLRTFYRLGVRMIALTWNFENEIGAPNLQFDEAGQPLFTKRNDAGLTPFGIEMIREMERLGMIIDVSHLSDGGFWDILRYTEAPFVASHSNAAAQCNICRNLTDEMIRALAERGGVMGLNYCYDFLVESDAPSALSGDSSAFLTPTESHDLSRLDDMVRHVRHIADVGGIEVCALGSDFDGIENPVEFTDASGLPQLCDALKKAGFTSEDVDKICFQNVLRVYKEVLK